MEFLFPLIVATCVAVPWLITMRPVATIFSFVVAFGFGWLFTYFDLPSTAGPLYGDVGIMAMFFMMASGAIAVITAVVLSDNREKNSNTLAPPILGGVLALVLYAGTYLINSTAFNAQAYASLVPHVEAREWNADFQPKDPKHFRVSSAENATFLAGRAMGQSATIDQNGQANSIGSQFQVFNNVSSPQIIRGELWTIVPIDWSGWQQQNDARTPGVPGYIKVSGENPTIPAEYVALPKGKEFKYTPQATFGLNLDRLVWRNHPDKYIVDKHLEIDEEGAPHYIVSIAVPTIGWWGEKIIGALIIDPTNGKGADKLIPLDEVPHWVDRVESENIVHRNIDNHSKYAQGFINRSFYRNSVLSATKTHFGFGSDGEPVFATGVTAHSSSNSNSTPDSLVAVYYTNTRTGKTVEYKLQGGATEDRAIEQCNLVGDVRNKHYHGTTPQLYNVYGKISYVVPLQNQTHAFAGVCIVDVMNIQVISWGQNAHDAELAFKQLLAGNSMQMAVDGTHKLSTMTGTITRVGTLQANGSTVFLFLIEGVEHLFTVPVTSSNKVPVTQVGDTVWIEYFDSSEEVIPVSKFDNKSITLKASVIEAEVRDRAAQHQDAVRAKKEDSWDTQSVLNKLSPEDRKVLEKNLKR